MFLIILPLPYQVTKVAQILSSTSFFFPQKRASQGLTVVANLSLQNLKNEECYVPLH